MKKILTVVLALCLLIAFAGCSDSTAATEAAADDSAEAADTAAQTDDEAASKGKIGMVMASMTDSFRQSMFVGAQETAETLGYELVFASAELDTLKETELMKTMAAQDVELVIFNGQTAASATAAIDVAHDLGMKVCTIDCVDPESKADCQIGGNDFAAGQIAAEKLVELLDGKGKVAISQLPIPMPPNDNRVLGFYDVLDQYPDIEVVTDTPSSEVTTDGIMNWTKTVMQTTPDLDAFISICDFLALPVTRAVENEGNKDIIVVTCVESETSYQELTNPESPMKSVIALHSYDYGALAAFALDRIANDRPVPSLIETTGVAVTAENVEEFIQLLENQELD